MRDPMANDLEHAIIGEECYICLEGCTERSPCLCQSTCHMKCLQTYMEKSDTHQCDICHTPLKIEYVWCTQSSKIARIAIFIALCLTVTAVFFHSNTGTVLYIIAGIVLFAVVLYCTLASIKPQCVVKIV